MTANNKHLKKHHDTYVYSRRVPKDLQHLYPKTSHITFSLKTSCVKTARIKRDRFNGQLAAKLEGVICPERTQFVSHLSTAKEYAEMIKAPDSALHFDDVFPREESAKAAYRQVAYGDNNHRFTYTIKEALMSMLSRKHNLSEETKQKVTNSLNRFLTFIDVHDIALKSIDKKRVVEYVAHLGEEYAHGTISAHLSRLKSIWTHAYQMGEVSKKDGPFEGHDLSPYKTNDSRPKQLFTKEQLQIVLNECPSELTHLTKLALYTGARLSELCNASVEDIEGIRCLVIHKGKTESAQRYIPLAKQVIDLPLPLNLETKAAGRLFSRFKTSEVTRDSTRSFHSLRNHFITAGQRAEGLSEFDVAYVAGHKTGTTMSFGHYARHDVKRLKDTVETVAAQIEKEWL